MSVGFITKTFFQRYDLLWKGNSLQDLYSRDPEQFLPLILLLVDAASSKKFGLNLIISHKLIANNQALFGFSTAEAICTNPHMVENAFEKMAELYHFAYGTDRTITLKKETCFTEMMGHFRESLKHEPNGEMISAANHEQLYANVLTWLRVKDRHQPVEFSIDTVCKSSHSRTKQLFEEMTIVAVAKHLTANPELSVENLKEDNQLKLEVDEKVLLAAALFNSDMLGALSSHFSCLSYQLAFDEDVYTLRENIRSTATTRTFGEPSRSWYQYAKQLVTKLALNNSLKQVFAYSYGHQGIDFNRLVAVLLQSNAPVVSALKSTNQTNNITVRNAIASQQMRIALNKKVIGQEHAIKSLCQGYLTSTIQSQTGPRTIYTFAGPSGVGKTYLASQLQSELNAIEKSGYKFSIFNMENYIDEKDTMKLFGSGSQYVDSSLGVLTNTVRAEPRQILLFDEIEKAHSVVIQSLLTVLDKGITKDQTSQEEVDFSQCIVIFTTNLGQDLLADNPENKPLSVFDLLSSSKNASNKTELSPEFINRLAKGYPIIFNKMRVNHLLRLAERTIGDSQATNEQFRCHFPEEFASFMLKTMSPELSVRRLQTALTKLQSEILSSATPYLTLDADQVVVDVEIETQDAFTEQSTIKLLLLDDDHRVYDQLNSMNTNTNRSLCSKSSDVRSAVESHLPDALLIDLDTLDGENLSLEQFIENEAETLSKLPIFTYRIVEGRAIESSVSCLHDVREHFVIGLNDFEIAFISMLGRIDYYVAAEKMLLRMVQRKEELSYRCSIESSEQKLIARFHNQGIHQVIQSEDLRDSDFFKMSLPDASLDDVIGLDRAKKRLTDVINWLKTPEKLTRFGVRVPSGFLFAGPPGTGKTLLAKAVAGESKMPFFAVSASELTENHLGGTTKNIQKLFETARKYAPSIIFIDEIDAIAAKRTEDAQGADRERNLIVNALLTEMDGFNPKSDPVFVMAATNLPQSLDPAIVRPGRFDETIMCDLPNRKARELFFNRFSARYNVDFSANDLAELASSSRGMSSAQIEQVFREAIYQAVGEGTSLSVAAVKNTMVRVMYGSPTENIVMSEKEKLRTAYHEAGHLLVSRMLFPNQAIDFVTIEPRNQALGFVVTRPEELYDSFSTIRIKHRLEMLLAGRIAEKLFTGCEQEISSGASNDIKKATELAMHAIYESGLEPEIGPVNVAILTRFEESNILIAAQNAVQKWIRTAEVSVEQRLLANKELLDLVATTLHSQESMLGEEIENLLENCSLN